ncbi:MAG: glycosyltransferase [Paludibacteraceae bacterium]
MKRILIISDALTAPLYGVRVRFLCNYLVRQGWNVRLCTEHVNELPFEHAYPIDEIEIYRHKGILGTIEWSWKSFCSLLFDYKNRVFAKKLMQLYVDEQFDLVCCSVFNTFPLRAAANIAHRQRVPLHVDLRDIAEQMSGNLYNEHRNWWLRPFASCFRYVNIKRRNTVVRMAQSVSSVSPWHVNFISRLHDNVALIYNGFDADLFVPKDVVSARFTLIYAGKIYGETMQNPHLLFEALRQIVDEQSVDLQHFAVEWYTDTNGQQRMAALARHYGVERMMRYHDYVEYRRVPALLHTASVVLVLSNKECAEGPHGVMTTKFFEALGVEKPILCVRSDEACLAAIIRQTNAGIAITTADEVKQFILDKYHEWQEKGYTHQPVNQVEKVKYSRQAESKQFVQLFKTMIR